MAIGTEGPMRTVGLAFLAGAAAATIAFSVLGVRASSAGQARAAAHAVDGTGASTAGVSSLSPETAMTRLPSFPKHCALPPGAAWAVARPASAPPFNMAVYRTGFIAEAMRKRGFWEMHDTEQLTRVGTVFPKRVGFSEPITLLDVGANVGTWSFFFVAQGHRVRAAQPLAEKTSRSLGRMTRLPAGLGWLAALIPLSAGAVLCDVLCAVLGCANTATTCRHRRCWSTGTRGTTP